MKIALDASNRRIAGSPDRRIAGPPDRRTARQPDLLHRLVVKNKMR
jgi:hypothetical protein